LLFQQQQERPVLEGGAYENLFRALKSKETKATYAFRLRAFLSYMNVHTPEELLLVDKATMQKKIISYILHLKNEKSLSYSSLEGVCAALRKFYSMNDLELNWNKIHAYLGEREKTVEDKAYTSEQVKRLLQFSLKRTRVMILLLASSGMRRGALLTLRKKHLTYIEKYRLYKITVYPKAKERYITFCTPECASEINSYFDYRTSCGEVINDDSPVIRDAFDRHNKTKAKCPKPVSDKGFKFMLEGVIQNAGLKMRHEVNANGKVSQRTEIMCTHGLRKFFDTSLSLARLHPNAMSALMGRKGGLQYVYDKSGYEALLEEYVMAIDFLTINDENRLRAKVETLQDKDKEIQELRAKMAKMEESQLKITELLEVMKIAKSSDGKVGKDRTMLDERRRVTIGYVDDNNQGVEMSSA
jgi:integrase